MKRILYILILGFTLASCDDFLTEEPAHSQTLDNAVTNYDGAKNVINGMYATLTLGLPEVISSAGAFHVPCPRKREYPGPEVPTIIRCPTIRRPTHSELSGNNGMPA